MTKIERFLKANRISRNVFESALSLLVECINDGSQELKIEIEPELMTLQEALDIMVVGDSFKLSHNGEVIVMVKYKSGVLFEYKYTNEFVLLEPHLLKETGKIIPIEPETKSNIPHKPTVAPMPKPELTTLQEAMFKIKKGDRIKDDQGIILKMTIDGSMEYDDSVGATVPLKKGAFERRWQIIPATPIATTIEEWITKRTQLKEGGTWYAQDARQSGEFFNKQQWENHQELRETVERFSMECTDKTIKDMLAALKNLKPLKAE